MSVSSLDAKVAALLQVLQTWRKGKRVSKITSDLLLAKGTGSNSYSRTGSLSVPSFLPPPVTVATTRTGPNKKKRSVDKNGTG